MRVRYIIGTLSIGPAKGLPKDPRPNFTSLTTRKPIGRVGDQLEDMECHQAQI